jgi:hypothetical protein
VAEQPVPGPDRGVHRVAVSHLGDVALDEVVAAVKRRLRRRKERRPRFVIYGPDGETLREFDLPDEP